MKDYLDLSVLLQRETLDTELLVQAVRATFQRRGMEAPTALPSGLTDEFAHDPSRQALWQAFLKKNDIPFEPLTAVVDQLRTALAAALLDEASPLDFKSSSVEGRREPEHLRRKG